jgi:hypothetical protein
MFGHEKNFNKDIEKEKGMELLLAPLFYICPKYNYGSYSS